jgi:hypothetical protein
MEPVSNANVEDFSDTDTEFSTETDYEHISDYEQLAEHPIATRADMVRFIKQEDMLFLPPFESKFKNVKFIMPDVDLNVCPLDELKLFEFQALYSKEMAEHSVSEDEMLELIREFSDRDLASN